jgi:hypothetical protein
MNLSEHVLCLHDRLLPIFDALALTKVPFWCSAAGDREDEELVAAVRKTAILSSNVNGVALVRERVVRRRGIVSRGFISF